MKGRPERIAWWLALGFAAFRLLFIQSIQLAPDEAYYWEWSRRLDWSYYDQGPMLALVIRAGTWLLGPNEWGVRLGAVLAAFGISAFYIQFSRKTGKPELAPWLVLAANSLLLFSVGGVLMMHDSLAAFFWCLGLWGALRAIEGDGRWWLLSGLAGGLAVLSKYTGILLLPCLFIACAGHPGLRRHLKSPWFWGALLLGGAVAGYPILRWNIQHQWPSLQHVLSLSGGDHSRRSLSSFPEFIGSQFGLITPILFALLLSAWHWAWQRRAEHGGKAELRWLLLSASLPVFLLFLALSLRSRVEGNWPAPAYLAALPLTALFLDSRQELWGRRSRWALGLALGMMALVFSQAAWGWLPLPKAHAARMDATLRLQGWRELAARVAREEGNLGPDAFVGCRTYQNAAELAFYLPGLPEPLILQNGDINHQYRFWNRPDLHVGKDAVLVIGQAWEVDEMQARFQSMERLPDEVFVRDGVEARRSQIYVGRAYKGPLK